MNAANGDVSAAIDKHNKLHVAYFSFNLGLKYATNKTGSWVKEIISASVTARGSALVVEPTGKLFFIYCVKGANALRVITK